MGKIIEVAGTKYTVLQKRMNYTFKDRTFLEEALRHPSLSGGSDNQRLEFLGDRVLGLVIAEELIIRDPKAKEGELAPRYNHLVRKEACASVAESLQLGTEIKVGRSEAMSGGRRKIALLGDVTEAMIAAVYLDGGFSASRKFILQHWAKMLDEVPEDAVDPKTRLQEIVQGQGEAPPRYELIERSGPDHAPEFIVEVQTVQYSAQGKGLSKRKAEAKAATALLKQIEDK